MKVCQIVTIWQTFISTFIGVRGIPPLCRLSSILHQLEALPQRICRTTYSRQDSPSDIFVVEEPPTGEESMTSDKVAEYLERVRQEDSSSYFNTPPGTLRRINFEPASPLNDREEERNSSTTSETSMELPPLTFVPRKPGRGAFPRGVALSQPAPGLGCSCKRVRIGRGHGCSLQFPRWYFNY